MISSAAIRRLETTDTQGVVRLCYLFETKQSWLISMLVQSAWEAAEKKRPHPFLPGYTAFTSEIGIESADVLYKRESN